jgi:thiol-disulfide isomerase/thioredoxin
MTPPGNQTPDPQTVAECLKAAQGYAGRRAQELRAAGQTPDLAKVRLEAEELARKYAARFSIEQVAVADLPSLARLHVLAKQPDRARQSIARALSAPDAADPDKADALLAGVDISMASPVTDEGIRQAEDCAARLDAMGASVLQQKIQAHQRLGNYFRAVDVDDKIFLHASKVIDLAKGLPESLRPTWAPGLAAQYSNLAEVYGGWEQAHKAIEVLQQGLKDLPAAHPGVRRALEPTLERYRLVGTVAPSIEAPTWLNAPAGTTRVDPKGTVSVIQFTAHWCGPCRKSYPSTLRLHNTWAPKGLQVIFSTELYGFFKEWRPLSADQEVEMDRRYFAGEHGLPFKIAIEPPRPRSDPAGAAAAGPTTMSDRYKVGGIPHIVVTDKQGKIRLIVIGWDPAAEARLNKLVERLLAEKGTE